MKLLLPKGPGGLSFFRIFVMLALVLNSLLVLALVDTLRSTKVEARESCLNSYCVHWGRYSSSPVLVLFKDYSGPAWPTREAVNRWEYNTPNLSAIYRPPSSNSGCWACVDIRQYSASDPAPNGQVYLGHTYYSWDSNAHFKPNSVSVWLNNYYPMTWGQRLHDACHETGHALGVGHHTPQGNGSCMVATVDGSGEWPLQADYNIITWIHNHVH